MSAENGVMPESERLILAWARVHDYPVHDRIWRNDLSSEFSAEVEAGYERKTGRSMDRKSLSKVMDLFESLAPEPVYSRKIWVPRGMVTFLFQDIYERARTEQDLAGLISSKNYLSFIGANLGPRLEKWMDDTCTEAERRKNAGEEFEVSVNSDGFCDFVSGGEGLRAAFQGFQARDESEGVRKVLKYVDGRIE